jgi:hypothetical protein
MEQTTRPGAVSTKTALFTFYDIESLSNAFTLCAYTPRADGTGTLEVFYLLDAAADGSNLADDVDPSRLGRTIFESNPGLPAFPKTQVRFYDLRQEFANVQVAKLMGLSSAEQVNDPNAKSAYPAGGRPVCDTDPDYDAARHPFLAGYNSMQYDTVMIALYLSEVFASYVEQAAQVEAWDRIVETSRNPQEVSDARIGKAELLKSPPAMSQVTARAMREHNNMLFTDQYSDYMPGYLGWGEPAQVIRQAMMHSGRHLDVARLNELQFKVSLKRLLGMLGRQIKESEKLGHDSVITSVEELYELLAYNVSDCLGLAQLFRHPTYSSAFDLKAGLLAEYPETVYRQKGGTSRPNISPTKVRRDRLTVDSSSAKFVGRILSPYGELSDIEGVSYLYPHAEVAREQGVEQMNVLEHCKHFFETRVAPDYKTDLDHAGAYEQFLEVYEYYRSIEGENFNETLDKPAKLLRDMPKRPNNLPYFDADGRPTTCFATFSTGGIHGAEADERAYQADLEAWNAVDELKQRVQQIFPNPLGLRLAREVKIDGQAISYTDMLVSKATIKGLDAAMSSAGLSASTSLGELGEVFDGIGYKPARKMPELFVENSNGNPQDRSTRLHPKYTHTSAGLVMHEDFTSYYPNLLRNMRAFWNPKLGEDRYAKIFFDKERYGAEMKQPGITAEDKARLSTLRNGTKLILNSASGAGDASHKTPIRMNNQIISMRIIGQLFSWLIGQAQTLAGARIISTNTDGLYSKLDPEAGFDAEVNNRVLIETAREINIAIEPEEMFLISKDSNNRLELTAPTPGGSVVDSQIISASGGTLACHAGPVPTKSLAHPAVIDFALARYLQSVAANGEEALCELFDQGLGRTVIEVALDKSDPVKTLMMFQNVIAASRGSITYPFAADPLVEADTTAVPAAEAGPADAKTEDADRLSGARPLQMVNRVFVAKAGTPGAVSLHNAGAWKVNPASQAKRREQGLSPVQVVPMAAEILRHHGWATDAFTASQHNLTQLPADQDFVIRKINSIDPSWSMVVCNDDLHTLPPERLNELIDALDLEVYVSMLEETFTKSWMNRLTD